MLELSLPTVCALLVVYGVALAFAGYRIFQVCLGLLGFLAGVVVGIRLAGQTHVVGAARVLIVVGTGLLGGVAAAAIYHVGVFLVGGLALAGAVAAAGVGVDRPFGPWVLAGAGVLGGLVALALHRRLLVYATALTGALLAVAGLAPLVRGTPTPPVVTEAWIRAEALALPRWWLGVVAGIFVLGSLTQLAAQRRRRGGLLFAASTTAVAVPGEARPEARGRTAGGKRTHGAICPRCGGVVDVDALFCPSCGNDRWDV